jgi:hypothetical protein
MVTSSVLEEVIGYFPIHITLRPLYGPEVYSAFNINGWLESSLRVKHIQCVKVDNLRTVWAFTACYRDSFILYMICVTLNSMLTEEIAVPGDG